jgi:hypothetical protein
VPLAEWALVAAMLSLAAFAIYQTASAGQVAIHWGPDHRPDSWVASSAIHLINPVLALTIWFVVSFFHQGFATKRLLAGPARTRLSNLLLFQLVIELVIQLLRALYLKSP